MGQGRLKGAIDRYYASPVAADGKIFMLSETGKIAVKVINDYGDEVMKVFRVP